MFVHGWIEVTLKEEKYVIDTSISKAIPKNKYYRIYNPIVYVKIPKEKLLNNHYIQYFKEQLSKPNDFTKKETSTIFYCKESWFDLYENYWLQNIEDNSLTRNVLTLLKKMVEIKVF